MGRMEGIDLRKGLPSQESIRGIQGRRRGVGNVMTAARVRRRGKKGKTRTTACDLWPGERGGEARRRRENVGGRKEAEKRYRGIIAIAAVGLGEEEDKQTRGSLSLSLSLDLSHKAAVVREVIWLLKATAEPSSRDRSFDVIHSRTMARNPKKLLNETPLANIIGMPPQKLRI